MYTIASFYASGATSVFDSGFLLSLVCRLFKTERSNSCNEKSVEITHLHVYLRTHPIHFMDEIIQKYYSHLG